jgi:hypothetical protein
MERPAASKWRSHATGATPSLRASAPAGGCSTCGEVGVFDGIDPDRAQAIKDAVARDLRLRITEELKESIRRQVESDVRSRTERDVLRRIEERAPSDDERSAFRAFVEEVRVDAYAQAILASDIADEAEARGPRYGSRLILALVVIAPIVMLGFSTLGGWTFLAAASTFVIALAALGVHNLRRDAALGRRARQHFQIASEFLILAERAKAFMMVHAERTASSEELHRLLEDLRRDKERQDRLFDPSVHALEEARERARARIDADAPRLRVDDREDVDDDVEEEPPQRRRAR